MALNIGIDFCDDYITAYCLNEKSMISAPAVVCREKKEDLWYIGEPAYRTALSGSGVLTDKLLSLLRKKGTSTIARKAYTAEQLISKLIGSILSQILNEAALSDIGFLVIALKKADRDEMDSVLRAVESIGIDREKISVISHEEAFIHYVMAQDRALSYNMTGLFDLSGESLSYYKLNVSRGGKTSVVCSGEELEETFRIGILKNGSGSELADKIMTEVATKCMDQDIYSSVFLTGKGFDRTDWAKNFTQFICRKRRVMAEPGLFAIGAAIYAEKLGLGGDDEYQILCDTRTRTEVSLSVIINDKKSRLIMIPKGRPWYNMSTYAEVIPMGQNYIDVDMESAEKNAPGRSVRLELSEFPERPDRCTRVSVELHYEAADTLSISARDMGFGEIYPASDITVCRKVRI